MQLTVFNGSPRGPSSNTTLLLSAFERGFMRTPGNTFAVHLLHKRKRMEEHAAAFAQARNVLLAFPLYVHAMPGVVKHFLEALTPRDPADNVTLQFLVQSGFPEARQSRWLEPYLERLPAKLGCRYGGTIIKGGVEGIQVKPAWMTRGLYRSFEELGASLGQSGKLDPEMVRKMAQPERLSSSMLVLLRIMDTLGLTTRYWDMALKKNHAFAHRDDRPYQDAVFPGQPPA